MHREWKAKLSPAEREKFEHLTTESESDAFRILRNWSQTDSPDFYASCESLSHRLGISVRGASKLRRKFYKIGILGQWHPTFRTNSARASSGSLVRNRNDSKPH